MTDQKKLIDNLVEDLLGAIHKYDDSLYMATVIGCLEFVKQQLIDEANEDDDADERNFCPRCGKRTADLTTIHTCTPPVAAGSQAFHGFPHGPVSTPNAGGKCVTAGETAPPKEIDPNQWAFDNGLEST
jgi:hypothetical protein